MKWSILLAVLCCLFAHVAVDCYSMRPPENLTGIAGDRIVFLEWEEPQFGDWIHWDTGMNYSAIGTPQATTFMAAIRFSPESIDSLEIGGRELTKIRFFPAEEEAQFTLNIWTSESAEAPDTLLVAQAVENFQLNTWNTVELDTLFVIDPDRHLWIGYTVISQGGNPAGCDRGPAVNGYGNLINLDGNWTTLIQIDPNLNYNWNIQGFLPFTEEDERSRGSGYTVLSVASPLSANPVCSASGVKENRLTRNLAGTERRDDFYGELRNNLLGYHLYRDSVRVNMTPLPHTHFIDAGLENGITYSYFVTAVYTEGESAPTDTLLLMPEHRFSFMPPVDLKGSIIDENRVKVEWEPPEFGEWIHWDSGTFGNSIGTGEAAQFKVAIRFGPRELIELGAGGRYVREVRFVPSVQECIYTINIWRGGTSRNPGELIYEKVVTDHRVNSWNTVPIDTLIYVDNSQELWIGYSLATQTGHPAGCDLGPPVDGYGNLIYLNNTWSTLFEVNPALTGNWSIQAYVDYVDTEDDNDERGVLLTNRRYPRLLMNDGYNVYRNDELIAEISVPDSTVIIDKDLPPDLYLYYVTAKYGDKESEKSQILRVNTEPSFLVYESFDRYEDFSLRFSPWSVVDFDRSPTYELPGYDFPNRGAEMAFMIFNPQKTEPPFELFEPYRGEKMLASFGATEQANNDWLMTQRIELGEISSFSFMARSLTDDNGLERIRVGLTTVGIHPVNYEMLHEKEYLEVPAEWTEYSFDISEWDRRAVWLAINYVSEEGKALFIDDFRIQSIKETTVEETTPAVTHSLANYPNPFNPETNIVFSLTSPSKVTIEIFNIKGRKVTTLIDEKVEAGRHSIVWNGKDRQGKDVAGGVYFYRLKSEQFQAVRKMLLLK